MTARERAEINALLAAAARDDFESWLDQVSPELEWGWPHLKLIRSQLDRVTRREIRKLVLSIPPQHGKSEQVTIRYPAWRLERNPGLRVMVGGYSASLATKFSRRTRRIARSRIPLSAERTAVDDWETTQGGGLRAAGVGGGFTGMPGDLIIVDDPIKSRREANSRAYRNAVWDWFREDLYTRLQQNGAIIVIMTRWHHDDLVGRLLDLEGAEAEGGAWTVINLPALAEENDPLGRNPGQPLCPDRFDLDALRDKRTVLGGWSFEALYQGHPTPLGGGIIVLGWFKRYRVAPSQFSRIVQSWDTAQKAKEVNDYWVCTTWGETTTGLYLLDVLRERMEYPDGKRTLIANAAKWRPNAVLVEDKSSGSSLIQEVRRETALPVIAIEPCGDKETRAMEVSPTIEAGRVWLPESAPWLIDYERELSEFPGVENDDQTDSTSQYLKWTTGSREILIG